MARHANPDNQRGRGGYASRSVSRHSHAAGSDRTAYRRQSSPASYGHRPSKGGRGRGPVVFGIILAILVVVAAFFVVNRFVLNGDSAFDKPLENEGALLTVTIPEGSTTNDIAETLETTGLVSDSKKFVKEVKKADAEASLKPGTYRIICGTSTEEMVEMFQMGPEVKTVAIPEGYTIAKTAQAMDASSDGRIDADEFAELAGDASNYEDDYPFLKQAESGTLEGFLFPKTYEISDSATADSMIRLMLDQYVTETKGLDYSYPEEAGLNEYETLIMASIIEREATSDNRATVSSVFYNRIAEGMPLQSDATVAYLIDGDPTPEDLEIDSPYNTYLVRGLPLGPICSPSLASLKAACSPEKTDYLYFYFTEDGKYSFSHTYDEHQDAIAAD